MMRFPNRCYTLAVAKTTEGVDGREFVRLGRELRGGAMKYMAVALLVCASLSAQVHQQFEFRGIHIGETEQQAIAMLGAIAKEDYFHIPIEFSHENGVGSAEAQVGEDQSVYLYSVGGKVVKIQVQLNEGMFQTSSNENSCT